MQLELYSCGGIKSIQVRNKDKIERPELRRRRRCRNKSLRSAGSKRLFFFLGGRMSRLHIYMNDRQQHRR